MRLIEERVSVQVNDFANLESVCKARAVGRNNLKVHRLLYCYVLVERSARLELDGYDLVVWHVVLEAFASDTR